MKQEIVGTQNKMSNREKRRLLVVGMLSALIILLVLGAWKIVKLEIASYYNDRGYSYWQEGNLEEAYVYYSKAIQINPSFAEAYKNRGVVIVAQAKSEEYLWDQQAVIREALADLNKAVELSPDDPFSYWNRGRIYAALFYFDAAISDYTQAIELKPDFSIAYLDRGLVKAYSATGMPRDTVGAIADFDKALALGSTDPIIYYNRGKTYLWLNEPQNAIVDFNKALELNPNDPKIYSARGLAHEMAGNKEAALSDYRLYLELAPQTIDREMVEKTINELEKELADD